MNESENRLAGQGLPRSHGDTSRGLDLAALSWAFVVIALIMTNALEIHAEEPAPTADTPQWTGSWTPPAPKPGGWDWVRLSSNEWVKGEILLMRDYSLEFDSDEFGVVNLDWEDVVEVWAERIYTVVLEDMRSSHNGTMVIRGKEASIRSPSGIETFDRELIVAIVPDTSKELSLWSIRASAGIGLRAGNTESADLSGKFNLTREDRNTSTRFDYNGVYGSLDNVKNTNSHRGRFGFEYFVTPDVFLVPGAFEVFSDEFQNISYRLTPTVGAGYYLLRLPNIEWKGSIGVGYQYTRIDSAPSGDSKTSDNGAIIFGTNVDTDLTNRIDLIIDYQLQLIAPDTDLTNHHAEATFEIELTGAIDLDIDFIWDRIERPDKESDGSRPDTDDFRLTLGLAIEY